MIHSYYLLCVHVVLSVSIKYNCLILVVAIVTASLSIKALYHVSYVRVVAVVVL